MKNILVLLLLLTCLIGCKPEKYKGYNYYETIVLYNDTKKGTYELNCTYLFYNNSDYVYNCTWTLVNNTTQFNWTKYQDTIINNTTNTTNNTTNTTIN